ncbi:quinone oxidoreductase family protein [Rossellomorea vietnamensis]|uniref:Quinone oxidoreductase n=1 Tax=Rossellomorea vietnamensis TaxID=218284 RepID=A0A0P6WN67_9BACI|nr:zinc-binding dehydrogenase [Rossellomorea vietnamensis]KPL57657.1 quinone oxidoreductase [Rossellomorea vietnamensis]
MKAVLLEEFGGPEVLRFKEIDIPSINSNEVLIKVKNTSVNFADIKNRKGKKAKGNFPLMLGLDAAGIIEQVGSNVRDLKVGQRVIAFPKNGSYAEYVVADDILTFPIPEEIDFREAAASPIVTFLSFILLKKISRIEKGETVLVHSASGGVGTTAIQLAKMLGASTVIGTVGNENKSTIAKEAGADYVFTYESFSEKVNAVTGNKGVNIILDSMAGKVSEESLECLAPYGRLVHFGNSSGQVGTFKTKDLHSSCRSVLGFSLGSTRKKRPYLLKEVAEEVFDCLTSGKLKIKIGHEFDLKDSANAHTLMESRQHLGKILLNVEQ